MALLHSFEKSGNFLFRHRGEIPLLLIIAAIPVIIFTDYSWLAPDLKRILTLLSVVVSMLGFVVRAWSIGTTPRGTSGRNTDKQVAETLNKTGVYSLLRHPLYLGNYLMWIGIVAFTFNIYFIIIVSLAFWLYYERIMFAEERFLERKFGEEYMKWSKQVPAFVPNFRNYIPGMIPFSLKSVFRREYSGFLAAVSCFVFIDLFRYYLRFEQLEWNRLSIYILGAAVIITLGLRTLKHQTKLLDEAGRS